jgi:peptidoglycan/xylan/chitin deacetylase (PgdA/CDA1 family)
MSDRRRVSLVFDTELGWGSIENGRLAPRERNGVFSRCGRLLPTLLHDLGDLEIPTTWAVVGALVGPDPKARLDHLPADRVDAIRWALGAARPDSLRWPDLLERLFSVPRAEVGCHGYSHTRFDFPGVTASTVSAELEHWRGATGIDARAVSMVCPRDTIAHVATIATLGVRTLRLPPGYLGPLPGLARRLRWPSPSRATRLQPDVPTLTGVEGTLFFRGGPGTTGRARLAYSRLRARHALERHEQTVVWIHPFNFAESTALLPAFRGLLRRLARARDAGHLDIVTLGDLAEGG